MATAGTYVELIKAVRRDALDSVGSLFAYVDVGSSSVLRLHSYSWS